MKTRGPLAWSLLICELRTNYKPQDIGMGHADRAVRMWVRNGWCRSHVTYELLDPMLSRDGLPLGKQKCEQVKIFCKAQENTDSKNRGCAP